jgi:hypothetical protein
MKLSERQESALLYVTVFILLTANIYFEQWGLALALMLMMFFVEIAPLFTKRRVEEFSYTKLADALNNHRSESIKAERAQARPSQSVQESKPEAKPVTKDNEKSEAAAVALSVGKALAKNDRVKALGKMALNTAADKIEQEVKEQLKSDKKSKDEDEEDSEVDKESK